jgi:hypothetical protein
VKAPADRDIVERLREPIDPDDPDLWQVDKDRLDAAAEIERLRAVSKALGLKELELANEIERLLLSAAHGFR